MKQGLEDEIRAKVKRKIHRAADKATNAWIDSLDTASAKGDHRPAKDLLLHGKFVDPLKQDDQSGVVVQIGIRAEEVTVPLSVLPADT